MIENFKIYKQKDISEIDPQLTFFHYTNVNNLDSIMKKGLEPRIGENSLHVEKSKKIFFAIGEKGILTIMDTWLRWLTAKCNFNKKIYYLGTLYMKIPFCIKEIPNYFVKRNMSNKKVRIKVYNQMKKILDESIFLILDLKEGIDFDYNDIDEVKNTYYESFLKLMYPKTSDFKNKQMEYWNMHTYSNKKIESKKISLLKIDDNYKADIIIKILIEKNYNYVKENLDFLWEYYNYIYNL